jgi:hypothetical protein
LGIAISEFLVFAEYLRFGIVGSVAKKSVAKELTESECDRIKTQPRKDQESKTNPNVHRQNSQCLGPVVVPPETPIPP